LVEEIILTF